VKKSFSKIVVIGTSMGGVEALRQLAFQLPPSLNAPILVVQHTSPAGPSRLPFLLTNAGQIPAEHARDKARIEPGRIYVAPPDHHLETSDGKVRIHRGPKVNMTRPAIDNLFRSAARDYGENVIGVLLTGSLSDGVVGMSDIKQRGGITIVQDPRDALCPDLPLNALRSLKVDHTAPLKHIPQLLEQLVNGHEKKQKSRARQVAEVPMNHNKKGELDFDWICPECHGPLKELRDGEIASFRCRVGHEYSTENLFQAHSENMERALWAATQILEERAQLLRGLGSRLQGGKSKQNFEAKALKAEQHARELRRTIEKLDQLEAAEEG